MILEIYPKLMCLELDFYGGIFLLLFFSVVGKDLKYLEFFSFRHNWKFLQINCNELITPYAFLSRCMREDD